MIKTSFTILGCLLSYISVFSQQQLFIPDTLSGNTINLTIQNGTKQFYAGAITQTMGINGNLLAPTIILRKHQNVTMNVTNNIDDTTTIHWHGMHVAPENDGGPHITILSGATWSPTFPILNPAGTHWYHPHLHYKTYNHVQKGIAGFMIVRDSQEAAINLPRAYGIDDFPLAIQTKAFDGNNQIITTETALDTSLMVNGTIKPFHKSPAQVVRYRLLNGSAERAYNIGFSDNRSFYMIASDGGLMTAPVTLTRLLLSPGERAEILVNLTGAEGQTIELMNYGSQIPNATYGAAQPGMGPGQTIPGYTSNPLNGSNKVLLTINIGSATAKPVTTIPTTLVPSTAPNAASSNLTRPFVFMSMGNGPTAINGPFVINNAHFDMNVINEVVPFNNTEIWELRNQSPIAHPFHIHNVSFYILSVNGVAPSPYLQGPKDVVLVPAGNGTVRFITKFEDFYNDTLPYMYHCHMLTHEDGGMMGQFIVKAPCQLISSQPTNQSGIINASVQFNVVAYDTVGTSYQWQSNVGMGFQDLQNVGQYSGVNTAQLTVSGLALSNNNQLFRCKVSKAGCENLTNSASLSVGTTGLALVENLPLFRVGPNPMTNVLDLFLPSQKTEVVIFDILGKEVFRNEFSGEQHVSVSHLPNGMYSILLRTDSVKKLFKVIKG